MGVAIGQSSIPSLHPYQLQAACQMLTSCTLSGPSPSLFWAPDSCGLQAELCAPMRQWACEPTDLPIGNMGVDKSWGQGRGESDIAYGFLCMRRLRLVPGCVGPKVVFLQPEFAFLNLS